MLPVATPIEHSQASSPRSVALPQLPSSSTLPIGVVIWYSDPLETLKLVQGTYTPQVYGHARHTNAVHAEHGLRGFTNGKLSLGDGCRYAAGAAVFRPMMRPTS